jgi:hypothetical protein
MSRSPDPDHLLRQQQLLELLRQLADRIHDLDSVDGMLEASAELDRLLGTARSEIAHLDVLPSDFRAADHQRIVDDARQASTSFDQPGDDLPWRHPQAE